MSSPIIWSGSGFAKSLQPQINVAGNYFILEGTVDPTVSAQNAPQGSVYYRTGGSGGTAYLKQDNGSTTNWSLIQTAATASTYLSTALASGVNVTTTPAAPGEYRTFIRSGAASFTGSDSAPAVGPSTSDGMKLYGTGFTSAGTTGLIQRWEMFVGVGIKYQVEFYLNTGRSGYVYAGPQFSDGSTLNVYGTIVEYNQAGGTLVVDTLWSNGADTIHPLGYTGVANGGSTLNNFVTVGYFDVKLF